MFTGLKFQFIGQMADTPEAIEVLIKRFRGSVCSYFDYCTQKKFCILFYSGAPATVGLFGFPSTGVFDYPSVVICSVAEMEAVTSSPKLQYNKYMGVN